MHFLVLITLLATTYVDISLYSYGTTFISKQYNYYSFNFYKAGFSSNLSFDKVGEIYTIRSIYTDILIDKLGSVNLGFRRIKSYPLVLTVRDYIGIDFHNPRFSFGVFKRYDHNNRNLFMLRGVLKKAGQYAGLFVNKDIDQETHVNTIFGKRGKVLEIYGGFSFTPYFSFANRDIFHISTQKTAFSLSVDYTHKNYYSLERKQQEGLNLNTSFSFKPVYNLIYSNSLSFTYKNGCRSFSFNNSIEYNLPPLGKINLHDYYNKTHTPGISLSNHISALYYNFFADRYHKGYSLIFKRKPLRIRLSKTVQKNATNTRIGASLSLKYLKEDLEYFYAERKQYLILRSMLVYGILSLYSNAVVFSADGKRDIRFATGVNVKTHLQGISLSTIEGTVYYDKNTNGILDKGDEPLESIKVVLDKERFAYTNKNGKYRFSYVSKGKHTLYIDLGVLPAEMGSITGEIKHVSIGTMERKTLNFGIAKLGRVSGRVFIDVNVNNVFDEQDIPLASCLISINGTKKTWSWKDGKFIFDNLPPGVYRVKVEYCPKKVTPFEKNFYDIYVMPGDRIYGLDFPFMQGEEIKVKVKEF